MIAGSGIRDQGEGIRDQGSGRRDQGEGIQGEGIQGEGIRDQGSGIRAGRRDQGGAIIVRTMRKTGIIARIVDVKKPRACVALMGYLTAARAIFGTS